RLTNASLSVLSFSCYVHHRALHSFPTRRSSDLSHRTGLFGSAPGKRHRGCASRPGYRRAQYCHQRGRRHGGPVRPDPCRRCPERSEEHTSELQSRENLVCRLLLEKKKKKEQN